MEIILILLYAGVISFKLLNIIIYDIRYKKLKEELGYIDIKQSELSESIDDSPLIAVFSVLIYWLLPLWVISSFKSNINFKYASLTDIKNDLENGRIKLEDEEELHPVELVHKIKASRKSVIKAYQEYIEELKKSESQNPNANNHIEPDRTNLDRCEGELKMLRRKFDNRVRHDGDNNDESC